MNEFFDAGAPIFLSIALIALVSIVIMRASAKALGGAKKSNSGDGGYPYGADAGSSEGCGGDGGD